MRTNLIIRIPKNQKTSVQKNERFSSYKLLEENETGLQTFVSSVSDLPSLDPQVISTLDRVYLAGASCKLADGYWDTLSDYVYFAVNEKREMTELRNLTAILQQNPKIYELRIPTVYTYWHEGFHHNGTATGDHIDPLFDGLDTISSLTSLHINWTDFNSMNKEVFIDRLATNQFLREVNIYQGVFVDTDWGNKKISEEDVALLKKLLEVPENIRPKKLSDENIITLTKDSKLSNGAIRSIAELLELKEPLSDELTTSIKKLLEVPMQDEIVSSLTALIKQRNIDLEIWFHGIRINDAQAKILSDALNELKGCKHRLAIHAQNATLNYLPEPEIVAAVLNNILLPQSETLTPTRRRATIPSINTEVKMPRNNQRSLEQVLAELPAPYTGMTLATFKELPGMTPEKFEIFCQSFNRIDSALEYGISLEEFLLLEPAKLKYILNHSSALPNILTVVTKNHLLGIDTVLPEPQKYSVSKGSGVKVDSGEGPSLDPSDPFYHKFGGTQFTYAYPNNMKEEWGLKELTPEIIAKLENEIMLLNKRPKKLLHYWWVIEKKENGLNTKDYYSPDLPEWLHYQRDNGIRHEHFSPVSHLYSYYSEKQFLSRMRRLGLSIEKARRIPGFTQTKLEILYGAGDRLSSLLDVGIQLKDIARVDEKRLGHLLGGMNLFGVVCAAPLVNVFEIFGLPKPEPQIVSRPFFTRYISRVTPIAEAMPVAQEENVGRRTCSIL